MTRKVVGGIKAWKHNEIHRWIRQNYGQAPFCINTKCKNKYAWRFQWALIQGMEYTKDITHYIPLCGTCHVLYDRVLIGRIDTTLARNVRKIIEELTKPL